MKILLTGVSSFTGAWFARELANAGHQVVGQLRSSLTDYNDVRRERLDILFGDVEFLENSAFGDDRFIECVTSSGFDVICHHGAEVTDYKSWDFDPIAATRNNTLNGRQVLEALRESGGSHLLVTGSVFEPYEGVGDIEERALSPYGLSKHLSFETLRMESNYTGISCSKFVIPNPFGPYEEFRFTAFLTREWKERRTPRVGTPGYIRDNIHVSLLAKAYLYQLENLEMAGMSVFRPSGYVESQGAFAARYAKEISGRLAIDCALEFAEQTDFPEPIMRVNDMQVAHLFAEWDEQGAWDKIADYIAKKFDVDARS